MLSTERQPNTSLLCSPPIPSALTADVQLPACQIRPFPKAERFPNGKSLGNPENPELPHPVSTVPRAAAAQFYATVSTGCQVAPKIPKPLTEKTITEISTRAAIIERFDTHAKRLRALRKKVGVSDNETTAIIQPDTNHIKGKSARFPTFLLTGTLAYLDILANPPLLPARLADIFERDFRRVEPMFHTVFYRKYHPAVLADAKQEALLGLYKKWFKNRHLLDQSAAYIVTAGIYSVSNWRQKSQETRASETPLAIDNHGKVIGQRSQTSAIRGTDYLDFQIDLAEAADIIPYKHADDDDYAKTYAVMLDILDEVKFTEGQNRLGVKRGEYMTRKNQLKAELRQLLVAYGPQEE